MLLIEVVVVFWNKNVVNILLSKYQQTQFDILVLEISVYNLPWATQVTLG